MPKALSKGPALVPVMRHWFQAQSELMGRSRADSRAMRRDKAGARQVAGSVPVSALACRHLNPSSLYSPASAHGRKRKALVIRRRSSIFCDGTEEQEQLFWAGGRQVQNVSLYMRHLELRQETSACFRLVAITAFVLTNPSVVWGGAHVTISHFSQHLLQKLES